jgi:hypothetical protein
MKGIEGSVKVATFNLFGEDGKLMVETMVSKKVNVVCVQGVTKYNCNSLFRTFKSNGYSYSRFDQVPALKDRDDAEIIFSNIPVIKKEFSLFGGTSGTARGLSMYLVKAGHTSQNPRLVWIATSQLEPEGSGGGLRKEQIIELDNELRVKLRPGGGGDENIPAAVIFAGDTSIPNWQQRDLKAPDGWYDAWREKGTSANEKTSNDDRMDQIWWHQYSPECNFRCREFGLIHENGVYAVFDFE